MVSLRGLKWCRSGAAEPFKFSRIAMPFAGNSRRKKSSKKKNHVELLTAFEAEPNRDITATSIDVEAAFSSAGPDQASSSHRKPAAEPDLLHPWAEKWWGDLSPQSWSVLGSAFDAMVHHWAGVEGPQTVEVELLIGGPPSTIDPCIGSAAKLIAQKLVPIVPQFKSFDPDETWQVWNHGCEDNRDAEPDVTYMILHSKKEVYIRPARLLNLYVLCGGVGRNQSYAEHVLAIIKEHVGAEKWCGGAYTISVGFESHNMS